MKIALFHNLPSGGAKRHTYEQVRELARRGHQLVEYAASTAELKFCSLAPFVQRQCIFELRPVRLTTKRIPLVTPYLHAWQGNASLRKTRESNRAIAAEIDRENFELVLVKDCRIMPSPYVLRYLRTPSVFQCHHVQRPSDVERAGGRSALERAKRLYYAPPRRVFQWLFERDEQWNIQTASRVLTNSCYSQQVLAARYKVQSHIVYPGINTQVFKPSGDAKRDFVLCVGAMNYLKGHRFLVQALSQIEAAQRPALLIVANQREAAEEQNLRALAARLNVELRVEQILNDEQLVRVYNQARVFVYAPLQEALGMAPLEALACGTPVVAVAEGGVRETIRDGETGFLVPRDARAFADKLQHLLRDKKANVRMGQAGTADVRERWTWARAIDRLERELAAGMSDGRSS